MSGILLAFVGASFPVEVVSGDAGTLSGGPFFSTPFGG